MYKYINDSEKWPKHQYEEDPISSTGPLTLEKKKSTSSIPCFKFQSTNIFSDIEHIPNRSRKRIGTHRDTYVTGIGPLDRDQSEIELQGKKIKFFNVKEFGEYLETEAIYISQFK